MSWSRGFEDLNGSNDAGGWGDAGVGAASNRLKIAELSPGIPKATVVAAVIAKEEPRSFPNKKDPGTERNVMNLTVRDSPVDFINISCWGGREYIQDLSRLFHIGDVVEISGAQIQSKPLDGSDEKFRPWTPSMYQLNVSENRSEIKLCGDADLSSFNELLHLPVKASNDYYTLGDIIANGQGLHGEYVSLLAVVKHIGVARDIVTKNGRHTKRLEVKLFDETCASFPLMLWDEELVNAASTWTPRDQVLFIADVRVQFDNFRKSMTATAGSKTVIIVNPDTKEAHSLYQYALTADVGEDPGSGFGDGTDSSVSLDSIQTVYTVEQIKAKHVLKPDEGSAEYGITFAYLASFNVDGEPFSAVSMRCKKCRQRVDLSASMCVNPDCPQGAMLDAGGEQDIEAEFSIPVNIADCTGSLENCRINGNIAEEMLGCSPQEYLMMPEADKTTMKWKFLMEKCKIYFKTAPPSYERQKPFTRILACSIADPHEAVKHIQ